MKKSLTFIMLLFALFVVSGCEKTSDGAKKDTADGVEWSKDKVNDGAKYIEKKTD
jgi:predicted small secreted protein